MLAGAAFNVIIARMYVNNICCGGNVDFTKDWVHPSRVMRGCVVDKNADSSRRGSPTDFSSLNKTWIGGPWMIGGCISSGVALGGHRGSRYVGSRYMVAGCSHCRGAHTGCHVIIRQGDSGPGWFANGLHRCDEVGRCGAWLGLFKAYSTLWGTCLHWV